MAQIAIRVTTRSSKPGIGGWRSDSDGGEYLEVKVAEPPAEGAANEAVVRLLAKTLGLGRMEVAIISGQTSRHKRIALPIDLGEVRRRLAG
jgi:uncharacterized protein